jgi:hypothetical protein
VDFEGVGWWWGSVQPCWDQGYVEKHLLISIGVSSCTSWLWRSYGNFDPAEINTVCGRQR